MILIKEIFGTLLTSTNFKTFARLLKLLASDDKIFICENIFHYLFYVVIVNQMHKLKIHIEVLSCERSKFVNVFVRNGGHRKVLKKVSRLR